MQSLFNLAGIFNEIADFYLLSLNKDIDDHISNQKLNQWTRGPQNENIYFVSSISPLLIAKLIREIKPNAILLNGIFNIWTTVPGLVVGRSHSIRTIISPRGMLQDWALRRKGWKKTLFLFFLRLFLKRNEMWHATNDQEKNDIIRIFGPHQRISVAPNIPRKVSESKMVAFPDQHGIIRLVFLSLINPNKNLHLIIREVCQSTFPFILDIYGPIIDKNYWKVCQGLITSESKVTYKGPVPPWNVPAILEAYHFFVLPTQGENFGHAIFDALASGVPVIITRNTPWQKVEENGAGFYIDLDRPDSFGQVINRIGNLTQENYNDLRSKSTHYAKEYWATKDYYKDYAFLFES